MEKALTAHSARPDAGPALRSPRIDVRFWSALMAVWFLWGSTFAGMHVAIATMPPFVMASLRFTVAGSLLLAFCRLRGPVRLTRADWTRALVTGGSLLMLGNGVSAWTVQYLSTGVNSLLLSLAPAFMALIAYAWGGEKPTRNAIAGMAVGFVGLAILLRPDPAHPIALVPALVAVAASASWAFGSIYARRNAAGDVLVATGLQMLAGGLLIGLEAAAFGEWRTFDPLAVSAASIGGLVWLIGAGSLIGYSAYLYTMRNGDPTLASTYAYVNPIVSVALGALLFGERLNAQQAVAAAIIIGGVALMMLPQRANARPSPERS